jgi:hypothetical protein
MHSDSMVGSMAVNARLKFKNCVNRRGISIGCAEEVFFSRQGISCFSPESRIAEWKASGSCCRCSASALVMQTGLSPPFLADRQICWNSLDPVMFLPRA